MTEGIKYDSGKLRIAEMMQDFREPLFAVCRVWEFGADKYEKSNWKYVDNAIDRYTNAMLRHLMDEETCAFDEESHLLHAAHVAWNALARLQFILNNMKAGMKAGTAQTPTRLYGSFPEVDNRKINNIYTIGTPKNE